MQAILNLTVKEPNLRKHKDFPEGYIVDDPFSKLNGGFPFSPLNLFGKPRPHDLVVDFYGDARKLKLQLEGKIGSLNIQYSNNQPEVNFKTGVFHDMARHRQAEVNLDHSQWVVNSDWIFFIKEDVSKLTIRVHDTVDSIILSIPPGVENLLIRIFGSVLNILPRRYRKGEPFEYKIGKIYTQPAVSQRGFRNRNVAGRIDIFSRIAYSIIALIRLFN